MSKVFFVGCGPGDPELITIKAKKLIQHFSLPALNFIKKMEFPVKY